MKLKPALIATFLLSACSQKPPNGLDVPAIQVSDQHFLLEKAPSGAELKTSLFGLAKSKAIEYGIDPRLLTAIIHVESKWNPTAVSQSNAIGLMQIKASTAGREIYRLRGKYGDPSTSQLKDPTINIDIGAAYLQHLQQTALSGIRDPITLRYATIVAYVNGAGALLRTFSKDRLIAIAKINRMTPTQFYNHISKRHPATQAPRYLWKVNQAYLQG